jgi:hypothetical protein
VADRHDEVLDRAVEELRTLPPLDREAVTRIVSAAARAREAGLADGLDDASADEFALPWRRRFFTLPAVAGIAAAAMLVGFLVRGAIPGALPDDAPPPATSAVAASGSAAEGSAPSASSGETTPVVPAAASLDAMELAPVSTQFVFTSATARSVTVVGDFNGWDERANPLVRQGSGPIWSAMVPLRPGRHAYAFMVDGKRLELDPRAPSATDPDFGVPASVRIVGQP